MRTETSCNYNKKKIEFFKTNVSWLSTQRHPDWPSSGSIYVNYNTLGTTYWLLQIQQRQQINSSGNWQFQARQFRDWSFQNCCSGFLFFSQLSFHVCCDSKVRFKFSWIKILISLMVSFPTFNICLIRHKFNGSKVIRFRIIYRFSHG